MPATRWSAYAYALGDAAANTGGRVRTPRKAPAGDGSTVTRLITA
ncbi:hypothetical protein [Streptomyces albidochromogenes]|uniref:Uncharacterized protein n=1 Tax=Streptomyces albidochromogenes TaxID=329524 RepID=A0ABW6FJ74_9ACTN